MSTRSACEQRDRTKHGHHGPTAVKSAVNRLSGRSTVEFKYNTSLTDFKHKHPGADKLDCRTHGECRKTNPRKRPAHVRGNRTAQTLYPRSKMLFRDRQAANPLPSPPRKHAKSTCAACLSARGRCVRRNRGRGAPHGCSASKKKEVAFPEPTETENHTPEPATPVEAVLALKQRYSSLEEVFEVYTAFARRAGFSVRHGIAVHVKKKKGNAVKSYGWRVRVRG
ncbi:MAG: hypothetical protein BJ554DRAFT_3879 [Olpidium bornovanus]|uniref:FAR1 domain-containing protein n=1 Tax=Olpidium bornovanus TaxID=278681 RepID=A0A8H7ZNT4_9FUNG|nr:MAG: hypothetical protein BJ554DRAFT_3879 [Olpidium bornovanus]